MEQSSIRYLHQLGIEVWVERGSRKQFDRPVRRESRPTDEAKVKPKVDARPAASEIETKHDTPAPASNPHPTFKKPPSEKVRHTEANKDEFVVELKIRLHENVCIVDSLGAQSFVNDLFIFLADFTLTKPQELFFNWPLADEELPQEQDQSLDGAIKGFGTFFQYEVIPKLNLVSKKLLVILIGQGAVRIATFPDDKFVLALEQLPETAQAKRELWTRLVRMMN